MVTWTSNVTTSMNFDRSSRSYHHYRSNMTSALLSTSSTSQVAYLMMFSSSVVSFLCSILSFFSIIVFLCLCSYASVLCILCFIGNISTIISYHGGQHDGLLLSGSPPIFYIHTHICMYIFSWQINSAAAAALQIIQGVLKSSQKLF